MYDLSDEAIDRALSTATPEQLRALNRDLDILLGNPAPEARQEETRVAKQFVHDRVTMIDRAVRRDRYEALFTIAFVVLALSAALWVFS